MRFLAIVAAMLAVSVSKAQIAKGDPRLDAEARAYEARLKASPTIQAIQARLDALEGKAMAVQAASYAAAVPTASEACTTDPFTGVMNCGQRSVNAYPVVGYGGTMMFSSGGCANGSCSSPVEGRARRGLFGRRR